MITNYRFRMLHMKEARHGASYLYSQCLGGGGRRIRSAGLALATLQACGQPRIYEIPFKTKQNKTQYQYLCNSGSGPNHLYILFFFFFPSGWRNDSAVKSPACLFYPVGLRLGVTRDMGRMKEQTKLESGGLYTLGWSCTNHAAA